MVSKLAKRKSNYYNVYSYKVEAKFDSKIANIMILVFQTSTRHH